ncbi:MAG: tetratricopeptide repeat protein [Bryobacteraceae bacterium]
MAFRRIIVLAILYPALLPALQNAAARYFEDARQAYERQDWNGAKTAATKALAADPRMGEAEILLGLVATAQRQFSDAEQHFQRAATIAPGNYQAHSYLGSTYLMEGRPKEAAAAFEKVLSLNPGNPTAQFNLGMIALAGNAPAQALPRFEAAARSNPKDASARIGILESQLLLGRKQPAKETAQQLARLLDDRDPRLFQAATLLAQHGESPLAIEMLERAQRGSPQSYDVAFNLALAYSQAGRYDRAAAVLHPFAGADAKPELLDLFGDIQEKAGNQDKAERAFAEAARRQPGNEDFRFDYANALLQHGKTQAALEEFRKATTGLRSSAKLRIGLGSACYLAGDYPCAAEALLEAVKLKPDSAPAYFLLGEAYESAGSLQPAILAALETYLSKKPRDAWAYYHYALILYAKAAANGSGDFRGVTANLAEALRINPSMAEAHMQMGIIALAQDRTQEAIRSLERAVSLDPDLAVAHYRLGLAYRQSGESARAKQEMDRFRVLKEQAHYRGRVLQSLSSMSR